MKILLLLLSLQLSACNSVVKLKYIHAVEHLCDNHGGIDYMVASFNCVDKAVCNNGATFEKSTILWVVESMKGRYENK